MKIQFQNLEGTVNGAKEFLEGFEREFFERVWSTDLDVYRRRIQALQFENHHRVLDAGFGNGQWTICLAELNEKVFGVEYAETKLQAVSHIFTSLKISNATLSKGNTESLAFDDDFFDAIFCYGVVFLTDIRKTLAEFNRVLKKNGKLYFTANGLGWYLMCLLNEHNKSENYNPRQMAADAIGHTFQYFTFKEFQQGNQLFLSKDLLYMLLSNAGFDDVVIKPEGHINFIDDKSHSFYKHTDYLGHDFIFDVYCKKK